jgi:hypothetical protein
MAVVMTFSRELLRLLALSVFVVGLVAVDLRVLIPFVLLGYVFVRPRQARAWDANDEP